MTIKEKLERVLNTPEKVYLFSAIEVQDQFVGLLGATDPTTTQRFLRGRLRDYRNGVLYIDTGSTVKTLQFEDLTDIRLPGPKPITQNKMGFDA